MGAHNVFVTGVGGFANNAEGTPDAYVGALSTLQGAAEFSASVMVLARPNPAASPGNEFLFGNIGANQGWGILLIQSGDAVTFRARAEDSIAGPVTLDDDGSSGQGLPGGVFIVTMSVSEAASQIRLYINGKKLFGTFSNSFVPSTDRPTIGVEGPTPLASSSRPALSSLILGCAYSNTLLSDEQIWLLHSQALQTGDIVDGNAGGGFFSMASYTNVWSARRGNNARGVPASDFITGEFGAVGIGPVPPAASSWVDEVGGVLAFTRQAVAANELFVTAQRAINGL